MKKIKELLNKPIWSVMILLGSILPVIFVAVYNRGCADDFSYTLYTHQALENNTSVLKAALYTVNWYMNNWNGLYFATFLQSLSFTIFSQKLAFMNTILILVGIYLGVSSIMYAIFKRIARCQNNNWVLIGLFVSTYLVQTIPCPVEGLYWYNGAVNYVFAWGLCLLDIAITLLYMLDENLKHKKTIFVIGLLLTIMVAGTHQMVQGMLVGCLFLILIYSLYKKEKREISIYFICAVIGVLINLLCPGAQKRYYVTLGGEITLVKIFKEVMVYMIKYQIQWFSLTTFLLVITLVALAMSFIKQYSYMVTGKRLICVIITCQVFVIGEILIPLLSVKRIVPTRILNLIYFTSVLGMCVTAIACAMYLYEKTKDWEVKKFDSDTQKIITNVICIISALYIGIIGLGTCIRIPYGSTAVNALKDILSGEAARYASELDAREEVYFSGKNKEIIVEPLTAKPYMLFFEDLDDNDSKKNRGLAQYYELKRVKVE